MLSKKSDYEIRQMTEEERENYYNEQRKDSYNYAITTAKHFKIIISFLLITSFVYYGLEVKEALLPYFITFLGLFYVMVRILVGSMGSEVEFVSAEAIDQLYMMYIGLLILSIFGGFQGLDKILKNIMA